MQLPQQNQLPPQQQMHDPGNNLQGERNPTATKQHKNLLWRNGTTIQIPITQPSAIFQECRQAKRYQSGQICLVIEGKKLAVGYKMGHCKAVFTIQVWQPQMRSVLNGEIGDFKE